MKTKKNTDLDLKETKSSNKSLPTVVVYLTIGFFLFIVGFLLYESLEFIASGLKAQNKFEFIFDFIFGLVFLISAIYLTIQFYKLIKDIKKTIMKNKKMTSFRMDETILEKLKNGAAGAGINRIEFLNNIPENLTNNELRLIKVMIIELNNRSVFPINFTNDELILIIEDFCSKLENLKKIQVSARKSFGDKGISFLFELEYKSGVENKNNISFSINHDFEIKEYFVYDKNNEVSSSINNVRLNSIVYIVKKIFNEKGIVRDINTSIKDEWSLIYLSSLG